jgi:hypothetical protein
MKESRRMNVIEPRCGNLARLPWLLVTLAVLAIVAYAGETSASTVARVHHSVTTANAEAQREFDEGLTLT